MNNYLYDDNMIVARYVQCLKCGHIWRSNRISVYCNRCTSSGAVTYLEEESVKIGDEFRCGICGKYHEIVVSAIEDSAGEKGYMCKKKWVEM